MDAQTVRTVGIKGRQLSANAARSLLEQDGFTEIRGLIPAVPRAPGVGLAADQKSPAERPSSDR